MSFETTFITELRKAIAEHRQRSIDLVTGGGLDEKAYGYSCGYIKALDDMTRQKSEDSEPGIIEHVLDQMQRN